MAVMAAGNRDPERFPILIAWTSRAVTIGHLRRWERTLFRARALARIEGQTAFELMLRRLSNWTLDPVRLVWRSNLALRGLTKLPDSF